MANTQLWTSPSSWANAFETADLASLANGSTIISTSTVVSNGSGLHLFADISIRLASISPSAGGYLAIWLLALLDDGSTYQDGESTATAANQAAHNNATIIPLRSKASSTQNQMARRIVVPPGTFKWYLLNQSGVTLSASTNVAKYQLYDINLNG